MSSKMNPAIVAVTLPAKEAKVFNDAAKKLGAVFVEKRKNEDGTYSVSYTVPTAVKEAFVKLLADSKFSLVEARKSFPSLFEKKAKAKEDDAEDDETDDEEDDEDDLEESENGPLDGAGPNASNDDGDDPQGLKGAGEGSKDWKSQQFNGEPALPARTQRTSKFDSVTVKASETFRIPGTPHIIKKGESVTIYPKK